MGRFLSEAAAVAFRDAGYKLPTTICITGMHEVEPVVSGPGVNAQMQRAYADPDVAKEYGACGVAAVAIERFEGLTIYGMARKAGYGFDYYLGPSDAEVEAERGENFFSRATHTMEVSGTSSNDASEIVRREREKLARLGRKAQPLPCLVVVIDFQYRRARMVRYADGT